MATLANLESFVRSAEHQSFSEAARHLGLTPAAVSRNVAMLEKNLGVRLFRRSTRKQTLTEAGQRLLRSIGGNLDALQSAISDIGAESDAPSGILRVSLSPTVGIMHIMPLLPAFLAQFPKVKPEWHFENRQVDLIAENYDAAIGGGFDLSPGIISRTLAPAHIVAVASPGYMAKQTGPSDPTELASHRGIVMRSLRTGRIRRWTMRNADGLEMPGSLPESMVVNDPAAMREAAILGLGVALVALVDVIPNLARGDLVRVLPRWYTDAGSISLYYASGRLMPTRTRAFVDFVADAFKRDRLAERFTASLG
ncbi:MAG: LysR family transcriptional regulator [Tardiphaga sp.]|jgi:DNA-binding transcriptional LysR family regulator|nr:LysR family transcriptional regulator [Tardiphaga sp.]